MSVTALVCVHGGLLGHMVKVNNHIGVLEPSNFPLPENKLIMETGLHS